MESPAWNPESTATTSTAELTWVNRRLPIILTLVACNGAILFGYHLGFSSPTDSNVRADAKLTKDETDFMFSLVNIGAMIGSLVAGKVADSFGRRKAMLAGCIPFTGGAIIMTFWVTYPGLCIGRLLVGFGVGYSSVLVPLYIAEIAPADLRGALGCANQLMIAFGIFGVNLIGLPTVEHPHYWKTMMLLSLIFVALQFFPMLMFGTETPRWLADHDRLDDARHALQRLRGKYANIDAELSELTAKSDRSDGGNQESMSTFLCQNHTLRPFLIGLFLVVLQQFSGINAFVFNTKALFEGDASNDENPPPSTLRKALIGAVIVNAVQFVSTAVSAVLVDKAGRRFLMLFSSIGMCISCIIMGIVYYENGPQGTKIAIVLLYFIFFAVGMGPIPWLLCSELFPSRGRGLLVSLATVVNWTSSFIVTFTFHRMNDTFKAHGTFWFYGGVCAVGAVVVYLVVPETKGKSLEEIEASFRGEQTNERQSLLTHVGNM